MARERTSTKDTVTSPPCACSRPKGTEGHTENLSDRGYCSGHPAIGRPCRPRTHSLHAALRANSSRRRCRRRRPTLLPCVASRGRRLAHRASPSPLVRLRAVDGSHHCGRPLWLGVHLLHPPARRRVCEPVRKRRRERRQLQGAAARAELRVHGCLHLCLRRALASGHVPGCAGAARGGGAVRGHLCLRPRAGHRCRQQRAGPPVLPCLCCHGHRE